MELNKIQMIGHQEKNERERKKERKRELRREDVE